MARRYKLSMFYVAPADEDDDDAVSVLLKIQTIILKEST